MKARAYSKINLSLDVFNVREDGYHDLKSIMIPLHFYDELKIEKADQDCFDCNKTFLKMDGHNSIFKMISIVRERYGIRDHFAVTLNKMVPTQAGLGGGTADAAAALRILKRMYQLKIGKEELREICTSVGADVLFNYYNVPSAVEGIGDRIEPFEIRGQYYVLLVKPKKGVSTKEAYEKLDMQNCAHPDIDSLKKALTEGKPIKGLLGNSLEQPALELNREIGAIKEKLRSLGAENVLMSGSGSTVFCISSDKEEIANLYNAMKHTKYFVRFTSAMNGKTYDID